MERPRIALLNAAYDGTSTRRNFRRELDAELVEFDAAAGELPDGFEYDAVVVTGSRASVYWDDPWIEPLKGWVGEAIGREIPSLGVCYGHQLLADVLGGEVRDMGEYELGYNEVTHLGNSPLFSGIGERFTVFTSHSDEVASLPPGAEPIAENEVSNHGFRKGHVFGVQFHPEYDTETARAIAEGKRGAVPDDQLETVLAGITDENYAAACEAKGVFENFTQYVRDQRFQPTAAD